MHHRKCSHCKEWFLPKKQTSQRFCLKPECRKASKVSSQKRWLAKPKNRYYWKTKKAAKLAMKAVKRVQAWRKANPHYWKRS